MKRLLTMMLALGLLVSGSAGVAAQDTATSIATGMNSPATYIDARGDEVATVEVTAVQDDWMDYDEYSSPERGYIFRAVEFTVTNISDTSLIVANYDFTMVDAYGRNNSASWVSAAEDSTTVLFDEDVPLAPDESADLTMVFETPADVPAQALMWQPEFGSLVMVNFGEEAVTDAALVSGMNTPSTWTDDRGNVVATVEVTDITADWQGYDDYSQPERGMMYSAVHVTITNVSDTSMILTPYNFTLLDNSGLNNSQAWVGVSEGSDEMIFIEDVPLAAGETYEGMIVFALYSDLEPAALVWQPDSGVLNIVIISADAAPADSGTPAAATPAA